jgi:hypothetical protein
MRQFVQDNPGKKVPLADTIVKRLRASFDAFETENGTADKRIK